MMKVSYSTLAQITLSIMVSSVAVLLMLSLFNNPNYYMNLNNHSDFITFMGVVASSLALVGSISFGFLLHYLQSIENQNWEFYKSFKSTVKELEICLTNFTDNYELFPKFKSLIDYFRHLRIQDFPLEDKTEKQILSKKFKEVLDGIKVTLQPEEKNNTDLQIHDELETKNILSQLNYLEEIINGFSTTYIKSLLAEIFTESVIKCFVVSALMIMLIICSTVYYEDFVKIIFFMFAVFFGTLTSLIFIEISVRVYQNIHWSYFEK